MGILTQKIGSLATPLVGFWSQGRKTCRYSFPETQEWSHEIQPQALICHVVTLVHTLICQQDANSHTLSAYQCTQCVPPEGPDDSDNDNDNGVIIWGRCFTRAVELCLVRLHRHCQVPYTNLSLSLFIYILFL